MQQIASADQLLQALAAVKRQWSGYTSNLFSSPEQIAEWVSRQALYLLLHERALLIFRRDHDFHHLYHAAATQLDLAAALRVDAAWPANSDFAVDLVGREAQVAESAATYLDCGFADYQSLLRLRRLPGSLPARADPGVLIGTAQDAAEALAFLKQYLDPLVEQVPELENLQQAAARGELLLLRDDGMLAGVLVSESKGLTTLLRYWFVRHDRHGKGIGALLIKSMFRRQGEGRRVLLWVVAGNQDAIAKYNHYGFAPDGIVDRVLIRRKGNTQ